MEHPVNNTNQINDTNIPSNIYDLFIVNNNGITLFENLLNTIADQMDELEQQNEELRSNLDQPIVYENTIQSIPFSRLKQTDCSICRELYDDNDEIVVLPCIHFYHKKCVLQHLRNVRKCPICNDDIRNPRHNNNIDV